VADFDGTQLAADLAAASCSYFKRAAAGLRKRGDYDVAQDYLKEYDAGRQSAGGSSHQAPDWDFLRLAAKVSSLRAERRTRVDPLEAAGQLSQVLRELSEKAAAGGGVSGALGAGVRLLQADLAAQLAGVYVQHHGEIVESAGGPEKGGNVWGGFSLGRDAVVENLGSAFKGYSEAVASIEAETEGGKGKTAVGARGASEREARQQSKASLKFARFCNDVLQLASGGADQTASNSHALPPEVQTDLTRGTKSGLPPKSQYPPLIVKHVLRALSLDTSLKPHQLLPRVLALLGLENSTHAVFEAGLESVPSWVFIAWVSQILSVMEQPEGAVLAPVLERMAEDYPQAIYYPFNGEIWILKFVFKSPLQCWNDFFLFI
jgi:hypothetical protein